MFNHIICTRGKGKCCLGDGLDCQRTFTPYIEIKYEVMSVIERFGSHDWTCAEESFIIKELGYATAVVFFLTSTVASLLTVDMGCLSGYKYKPKYEKISN